MAKKSTPRRVDLDELRRFRAEARHRVDDPTPEEQAEIEEGARELINAIEEARLEEARRKLH